MSVCEVAEWSADWFRTYSTALFNSSRNSLELVNKFYWSEPIVSSKTMGQDGAMMRQLTEADASKKGAPTANRTELPEG